MALELVTLLPPGAPSHTRLARHGQRLVVLREIKDGTDCSYPPPSPQMVTLQEVGELQGKRHALFDWVPGVTLRDLIHALDAAGNPIPLGLVGRVVLDACRALLQVNPPRAHGGLNDAALQIGFDGAVWVLDFGAPRLSRFRPLGRVNFAADVFAMGAVVHSCLTGFRGEYATSLAKLGPPSTSHAESSPALDDVVMRALSAQPDQRQPDLGAFADEFESVVADSLFDAEQVSKIVQTLFRDRIKLLQSLGGLVEDTTSSAAQLEAVLPMAGVPMGTVPYMPLGANPIPTGTMPGVPPGVVKLDGDAGPEFEEPRTQPRLDAKELQPIPKPSAAPPPVPLDAADPTNPRLQVTRASKPSREDTDPGASPPPEDTAPRARPSREQEAPRNTTERERHRARGQERIATPPPDELAALGELDQPTAVRARPKAVVAADPLLNAETQQKLPPVPLEPEPSFDDEPAPRGNGARWVIRVLALVVMALIVGVGLQAKKQREAAARAAQQQAELDALDAGEVVDEDAGVLGEDAGALAAAPVEDAGEADAGEAVDAGDAADAGELDAGVEDAGTVDAGAPDAGARPKKAPPKKKKRRR